MSGNVAGFVMARSPLCDTFADLCSIPKKYSKSTRNGYPEKRSTKRLPGVFILFSGGQFWVMTFRYFFLPDPSIFGVFFRIFCVSSMILFSWPFFTRVFFHYSFTRTTAQVPCWGRPPASWEYFPANEPDYSQSIFCLSWPPLPKSPLKGQLAIIRVAR